MEICAQIIQESDNITINPKSYNEGDELFLFLKVYSMDEYESDILNDQCVFFIVSTTGNGDPPVNGEVNLIQYLLVYYFNRLIAILSLNYELLSKAVFYRSSFT